jgi:hypothetical protein
MANEHALNTKIEKNKLKKVEPNKELTNAKDNMDTASIWLNRCCCLSS